MLSLSESRRFVSWTDLLISDECSELFDVLLSGEQTAFALFGGREGTAGAAQHDARCLPSCWVRTGDGRGRFDGLEVVDPTKSLRAR